jgi:RNA polymerase sigma-70 factor (ECF subfamily)
MTETTTLVRLAEHAIARPRREFDKLVQRHHKQAYNVAYRLTGNHADAEDLTQEAFVRAFRFFDNYRRELPFERWLFRIMSNLFIDETRKRNKLKTQSIDAPLAGTETCLDLPDTRPHPESMVLNQELDEEIQKALLTLPTDFQMTVILADIEGLSYVEVAQAMNCSVGTVRSRLHRGRRLLRAKLTGLRLS